MSFFSIFCFSYNMHKMTTGTTRGKAFRSVFCRIHTALNCCPLFTMITSIFIPGRVNVNIFDLHFFTFTSFEPGFRRFVFRARLRLTFDSISLPYSSVTSYLDSGIVCFPTSQPNQFARNCLLFGFYCDLL